MDKNSGRGHKLYKYAFLKGSMISKFLKIVLLSLVSISCFATELNVPDELRGKIITIVVPYGPGGNSDVTARQVATKFEEKSGLKTIVVNKPGGGGSIGAMSVVNSKPDGLTLCQCESTPVFLNKLLGIPGSPQYGQLVPVSVTNTNSLGVYTYGSAPYNNLKEFFKHIKENDVKINYSAASAIQHLWSELLLDRAKIQNQQVIYYKSNAEAVQSVVTKQTEFVILGYSDAKSFIENGLLKPLAAGNTSRLPELPQTRTISEDYPGIYFINYNGIFAPQHVPNNVLEYLNRVYAEVVKDSDLIKQFQLRGNTLIGGDLNLANEYLDKFYSDRSVLIKKFGHLIQK